MADSKVSLCLYVHVCISLECFVSKGEWELASFPGFTRALNWSEYERMGKAWERG